MSVVGVGVGAARVLVLLKVSRTTLCNALDSLAGESPWA